MASRLGFEWRRAPPTAKKQRVMHYSARGLCSVCATRNCRTRRRTSGWANPSPQRLSVHHGSRVPLVRLLILNDGKAGRCTIAHSYAFCVMGKGSLSLGRRCQLQQALAPRRIPRPRVVFEVILRTMYASWQISNHAHAHQVADGTLQRSLSRNAAQHVDSAAPHQPTHHAFLL